MSPCTHKACWWKVSNPGNLCSCGHRRDRHREGGRHGCEDTRWTANAGTTACPCIAFVSEPGGQVQVAR